MIFHKFLKYLILIPLFMALTKPIHALAPKQIMRNLGLLPRTVEFNQQKKIFKERKTYIYKNKLSFHPQFNLCTSTTDQTDLQREKLKKYIITTKTIQNNPVALSMLIELVKSYLYLTKKLYLIHGLNLALYKLPALTHSPPEIGAYDNDLAILPTEADKIHIPDSMRHITYIHFVIAPIITPLMTPHERKTFKASLEKLWFKDFLYFHKKPTSWGKEFYHQELSKIHILLDEFEARSLEKFGFTRQQPAYQKAILQEMLKHHWLAYSTVYSCPYPTPAKDPAYDAAFYAEPPVALDNYYYALGLYHRIEILASTRLDQEKLSSMKSYHNFFRNIYQKLRPDKDYWSKYNTLRKQHLAVMRLINAI